ncbi:hypothetical protein [Staphylococcus massiliensis]|uniref:Uncharacterized protein n=1 Tax=Staphylococcus massiliensis S46 TaxID=1229783 RepID=K9B5F1_9STAP|nr:hypothetical protein [Staphylococcus massiliensis]EKU50057.1 hypothetical protein C273_02273 [Staphylococcus massiliensis S46]MCG3399184.1 hypothetical protein [Staphylococcus massiliensis]MCG3402236.1 hypothetical protein [Staphylococcus massiliensis]MCG3412796.1 hypothetical protein [Staphylococcus massiliensis]POA00733.1 hypothetical protein CD133_03655 [Staphylococcus massiliensis CCUG 55927]
MKRFLKASGNGFFIIIGSYILLFIMDFLNLEAKDTKVLRMLSDIGIVHLFKEPLFNGLFTLMIVISIGVFIQNLIGKDED